MINYEFYSDPNPRQTRPVGGGVSLNDRVAGGFI